MRRFALGSILGGAAWHFGWEAVRAWLYEQGFHVVNPYLFGIQFGSILHYGITAALVGLGCWLFWKTQPKPAVDKQNAADNSKAIPDIDARAAYLQILESSEWRKEQDRTIDPKGLVSNWREVRLDKEIHKALRNSRLASWGEESLPGTATTPEKPIPPETWDRVEIVFDRSSLPRSAAHFKGSTSLQLGRMAWVGVRFSREQIFQLFPLASSNSGDWRPVFVAIQHIRERAGDGGADKCWPATRLALRQAAYDKRVTMKGRKHLPENNPHSGSEYSSIFTDVESDYWATSEINALATSPDCQSDYHTDPQTAFAWGKRGMSERNRYAELRINWADVLREWP